MGAWKVGFAKKVITPPMGVALAGYGLRPERVAGAVLDDLFVRTLILDDGATRVALVSLDLIAIDSGITAFIRRRVSEQTQLPADHIMITATHSHSAPTAAFYRQWGKIDPNYVRNVVENSVVETIVEATKSLSPATIGFGKVEVTGCAVNRVRKDGPVDHTLRAMCVRDEANGRLRAVAATFPSHPVCMPPDSRFVSAEWPGRLVRDVEGANEGASAVFFQGALGDINPRQIWGGIDVSQDQGRRLGAAVNDLLPKMTASRDGELAVARVDCRLPLDLESARREAIDYLSKGITSDFQQQLLAGNFLREWATEMLGYLASNPPDVLACEVQAIRIGRDAAIVGLPGEIYTLIGEAIRAASPFAHTWVLGFANGVVGYVVDPRDYTDGSYGADMTPKIYGYPPFKPEAWRVMADAGIAAMKKL